MKRYRSFLDEVVVVGYGQQKKHLSLELLHRLLQSIGTCGGVSDLGSALTGNLQVLLLQLQQVCPGEEDPQIVIREFTKFMEQ